MCAAQGGAAAEPTNKRIVELVVAQRAVNQPPVDELRRWRGSPASIHNAPRQLWRPVAQRDEPAPPEHADAIALQSDRETQAMPTAAQ